MIFHKLFRLFTKTRGQPVNGPLPPAQATNQPAHVTPASPEAEATPARTWASGIAEELAFWDAWLACGGQPWPEDYQFRRQPDAPLQPRITAALGSNPGVPLQVLDVGAGPLTALGKQWDGQVLQITAIDPLAEAYDRLLESHGVTPLVRTQTGFAERLVEQFGAAQFDLVYARNCIDHSDDPCQAIQQMVAVAKPGGLVYMYHGINEAESQHFQGFHQWNLFCRAGDLYVGNLQQEINLNQLLAPVADVTSQVIPEENWMVNLIRKR